MDDSSAVLKARDRCEPSSITLADLTTLVVGFALVFSLPQLHHVADRIAIGNVAMPGWVPWLFVVREVAMKAGLVLTPVIVARRARFGGLPRPAEWFAILVGLPLLHEIAQRYEWIKRYARWYLVTMPSWLGYAEPELVGDDGVAGNGPVVGDAIAVGYDRFPARFTPGDECFMMWTNPRWLSSSEPFGRRPGKPRRTSREVH
jgi:hypothetical protein